MCLCSWDTIWILEAQKEPGAPLGPATSVRDFEYLCTACKLSQGQGGLMLLLNQGHRQKQNTALGQEKLPWHIWTLSNQSYTGMGERKDEEGGREGGRKRKLLSAGSLLRWPKNAKAAPNPELSQARNQEICLTVPHGCRGPNAWTVFGCFSQTVRRQLNWKWNNWDTNWRQYRMVIPQPC